MSLTYNHTIKRAPVGSCCNQVETVAHIPYLLADSLVAVYNLISENISLFQMSFHAVILPLTSRTCESAEVLE